MIVVTGAAGFIGSVLVAKLNQMGISDIIAVDQNARNESKWNNLRDKKFSRYIESDAFLSELESSGYGGDISAIFHMGGCNPFLS